MDVAKILAELKAERAQIEEAIQSLERLALGRKRGPGRPRNSSGSGNPDPDPSDGGAAPAAAVVPAKRRGRPPGSKNKPRDPAPFIATAGTQ